MAVEAHRLHLFPPQLSTFNRQFMNTTTEDYKTAATNPYNTQMMGFQITNNLFPFYTCPFGDAKPAVQATNNAAADSGLTCNLSTPQQKRQRQFSFNHTSADKSQSAIASSGDPLFSFLGEDISLHIQHQQSEIDRYIAQHMEKTRTDLTESQQRHAKRMFAAVEEGMMKRLKAKEEEIQRMGRLNWVLEERVKSLCIENQLWRDLARTNEATANALRANLEQVLAQVGSEPRCKAADDDVVSCCGSNSYEGVLAAEMDEETKGEAKECGRRSCKNCGTEEACVLLLPCRHLCVCTKCGSRIDTCPICNANMSATVHVNIS